VGRTIAMTKEELVSYLKLRYYRDTASEIEYLAETLLNEGPDHSDFDKVRKRVLDAMYPEKHT
jgi:hypothetical protein